MKTGSQRPNFTWMLTHYHRYCTGFIQIFYHKIQGLFQDFQGPFFDFSRTKNFRILHNQFTRQFSDCSFYMFFNIIILNVETASCITLLQCKQMCTRHIYKLTESKYLCKTKENELVDYHLTFTFR